MLLKKWIVFPFYKILDLFRSIKLHIFAHHSEYYVIPKLFLINVADTSGYNKK